jgi:hypothetical protein
MEFEEAMSDLAAKQAQQRAKTDKDLTQTYVDALRKMKNYAEVQNAYGQGSGTAAAARIAQDTEMQDALTALRTAQMGADANIGMEGLDTGKTFREQLYSSQDEINRKRAEALLKAAEQEEANLYDTQLQIGQQLAKENNWSVLGQLYGLTQDQIDRIQGTGKYAPVFYYGGSSGGGYPSGGTTIRDVVNKLYGGDHSGISDKNLTQAQAAALQNNLLAAAQQTANRQQQEKEMAQIVAGNKAAARANKT